MAIGHCLEIADGDVRHPTLPHTAVRLDLLDLKRCRIRAAPSTSLAPDVNLHAAGMHASSCPNLPY